MKNLEKNNSRQTSLQVMDSTTDSIPKECRICRDTDSQDSIMTQCECSGTMKYAHKHCLLSWIRSVNDVKCGVCKRDYNCNLLVRHQRFWSFVSQEFYDLLSLFLITFTISSVILISVCLLLRMDLDSYNRLMANRKTVGNDFKAIKSLKQFYTFKLILVIENGIAFMALWVMFLLAVTNEWNQRLEYIIIDARDGNA